MIATASQAYYAVPAGIGGGLVGYLVGRWVGYRLGVIAAVSRLDVRERMTTEARERPR